MTLNFNLGLFLITQNHVFPSSWPVWVESLYFDLHYKYMFYNNCYTCALYIVHHYDISYLTPFVFLFHKKTWIKPISSPPAPPLLLQLSPFKAQTAMSFGIPGFPFSFGCRRSNRWAGSEVSREEMCQPGWGKPLQRMASSTVQEAVGSRYVYMYIYLYIYIFIYRLAVGGHPLMGAEFTRMHRPGTSVLLLLCGSQGFAFDFCRALQAVEVCVRIGRISPLVFASSR